MHPQIRQVGPGSCPICGMALAHDTATLLRWVELVFSAPVVLWARADYFRRGWLGVRNRSPNVYTLIGLGVAVAYLYSLFAMFAANTFPPEMRDEHGLIRVYFEVAATIIALVLLFRLITVAPWTEAELLALAAGLERSSEHPLARAIVEGAAARGVASKEIRDFESITGKGVKARDGTRTTWLGNPRS